MELYAKNTTIFRPWDTITTANYTIQKQNKIFRQFDGQDCTISTTTDNDFTENPSTIDEKSSRKNVETNDEKPKQLSSIKKQRNIDDDVYENKKIMAKRKTKDEKKQKRLQNSNKTLPAQIEQSHVQSQSEIVQTPPTYNDLYFNVPLIDTHPQHTTLYPTNPYDFTSLQISGVDSSASAMAAATAATIDPVIMESLALHGYAAMEEYVRIMNHEQQTKLLSNRKQRPKKYKCPHCNVGFSNNGQLKGHIRIHTGERPFRCDEKNCGKTFTRNEELTRHKRIHSGLRPFPCNACGKRFGRKDHLKKHTKTHITANQRNSLQLVPVVLPAGAWASIPPTSGIPIYNPAAATMSQSPFHPSTTTQQHHHHPAATTLFPYTTVPTAIPTGTTGAALYGL